MIFLSIIIRIKATPRMAKFFWMSMTMEARKSYLANCYCALLKVVSCERLPHLIAVVRGIVSSWMNT